MLTPQNVAARACPAREVWGWSPQHGGVPRFPALCSCSHPALSTLHCWARSIPKETQDQPPLCLPALLPPGQGEARFGTVPPRDPAGQGPGPGGFSCTHHLPAVTDRRGAHSLSLVPGPWPTPSPLSEKKNIPDPGYSPAPRNPSLAVSLLGSRVARQQDLLSGLQPGRRQQLLAEQER